MKKKIFLMGLCMALICLTGVGSLWAYPTDPVPLFGTRTSAAGGGVTATADWANGNFSIDWDITFDGTDYTYCYELNVPRKEFSHVLLQVTDPSQAGDFYNFIFKADGVAKTFPVLDPKEYKPTDPGNSSPGLPNSIYALKVDNTAGIKLEIYFDTLRAPVWGDFYTKDGTSGGIDVIAYNNGLANLSLTNPNDFIAVPDGKVPLPGAVLLLGAGMARLVAYARRRKD